MDSNNKQSLLVWDRDGEPQTSQQTLLWNGYTEKKNQRSILKALEKHSDELRSDYLSYIKELGQLYVRGKRIVEHLMIEKGFSLWWMSMLAEKGTLKSETPLNCLKLLALNQILIEIKPSSIELISNNKLLAQSLSQLCGNSDILFNWTKPLKYFQELNIKNLGQKLPHLIQSPIFLMRNLFTHWNLRKSLNTNWFSTDNSIFFFSYFLNMDLDALKKGKFFSKYWYMVPSLIKKSGKKTNWIHHFMESVDIPNTKTGTKYLKIVNEDATNQGHHNFLYSFLSLLTIAKAIKMWVHIVLNGIFFQKTFYKEVSNLSQGWLWPLIREDWKSSVYGKTAIQNIIWIYLLDKAMSSLPKQKTGLYLCENQGWERAFIHYWKKYGHGELIGVAHSTIRYWDLRYFDDPQVLRSKDPLAQPLPDKIALNGPVAFKAFREANQPEDRLEKVEAIRYQHLSKLNNKSKFQNSISNKKTILIVGDYVVNTTNNLLSLIDSLDQATLDDYNLIIKPHPATKIELGRYIKHKIKITTKPIGNLLSKVDLVISSGNTVAAIEALLVGLPVIVTLENNNFNFSPLKGETGVKFIRSNLELKTALENLIPISKIENENKYFWINPELPRWKALLNIK